MTRPPAGTRTTASAHYLDERRLSFGRSVARYETARPGYPAEAVPWLTGQKPARVLELGAGTGKLTRALLAAGHSVIATDADPVMLARLHDGLPGVPAVAATAERIPLPSRSVDVVVAAQSLHWFDLDRALPEIARVLRPAGVLSMVWNVRDEGIPWVARLGRLIGDGNPSPDPVKLLERIRAFGFIESEVLRHWHLVDRDGLLDMVSTLSSISTLPEAERAETMAKVQELYDGYGRGADGMQLPYLTHCYRTSVSRQNPDDLKLPPLSAPHAVVEADREHSQRRVLRRGAPEETQPMNAAELREALRPDTPGHPIRTPEPDGPIEPPTDDDGVLLIDFR